MVRRGTRATAAQVRVDAGLRSSLVHLPAALCSTLVQRGVVPQTLLVELGSATQTYYCGWTGLSAPASMLDEPRASTQERVSLSSSLATLFQPPLRDGDEVSIRLFRSPPVPVAKQVQVTPLHADDWEILSIHADEVEGSMLSQVRAARQGQRLAVHVGRSASTVVRFVVDSTDPATGDDQEERADGASGTEEPRSAVAVRLSTDTEVVVAPKTRRPPEEAPPEELVPTSSGDTVSGPLTRAQAAAALPHVLWRVLPRAYSVSNAEGLSWTVVAPQAGRPASTERPAWELIAAAYPSGKVCVTKAACPTVKVSGGGEGSESEQRRQAPSNPTASAACVPGDAADAGTPDDSPGASASMDGVAPSEKVADPDGPKDMPPFPRDVPSSLPWPAQHVGVGNDLREKLGLADGDLVVFSAPPPGALRDRADASSSAGPRRLTTGRDAAANLPGMDALVTQGVTAARGVYEARALLAAEHARLASVGETAELRRTPRPYMGTDGLLLYGGAGAGKTSVARAICAQLASDPDLLFHTQLIDCSAFAEERMPLVRARCKEWLDDAAWHAPSALVLDNLDTLMPAEAENVDGTRAAQLANALLAKVSAVVREHNVLVIATAQASANLHAALVNGRIWTDTVSIKPPGKEERRAMLEHMILGGTNSATALPATLPEDLNLVSIVSSTDGYNAADLRTLVHRAMHQCAIRCARDTGADPALQTEDFRRAQDDYTPLSLRNVKLQSSTTEWADIGGLHATRQTLRETLEWPTKYAAIFAKCPLRLRSGLLLYGYPGCGKTLLASAVAKECGLHFISVKGPELLNKYIGASEKSVRELFERAQAAKPCVLFFDEFDSIAPKRGHDSTGVTDRVVNQLLTQMDGAEGLDGVYVLAATSRPDLIDAALLRPGRLDKSLLCDMPAVEDRAEILTATARKVHVHPSVDLNVWAQRTEGFTGADLQALLYNAHLDAIHDTLPTHSEEKQPRDQRTGVSYVAIAPSPANGEGADYSGAAPTKRAASSAEQSALVDRLSRMLAAPEERTKDARPVHERSPEQGLVYTHHLERALESTKPSVPLEEVQRLTRIYRSFAGEREAAFPDGSASNAIGARTSLM